MPGSTETTSVAPAAVPGESASAQAALPRVSVVIPCLNEAANIQECVGRARAALDHNRIAGEVIVADNASDDDSARLARDAGATVVEEPRRGYGNALLAGFDAARGEYIVMADADLTYDFEEIPRFVAELEKGADMVLGDRMENIQPGAMPWLNRYIGNPLLSGFLNFLFRTGVRDIHCGMRALRRDVLATLDLRTSGMEFASEMVIRASKAGLRIREFPIHLRVRGGDSKLSPLPDGWRHLRLILIFSPQFMFTVPGLLFMFVGVLIILAVLFRITLFGRAFYIHTEIAGSLLVIVGLQMVVFGLIARTFGVYFMGERDPFLERMRARFRLEHGLLLGGAIIVLAVLGGAAIVGHWIAQGAGTLGEGAVALVAATVLVIGVQIFFASFLLSILGLRRPR